MNRKFVAIAALGCLMTLASEALGESATPSYDPFEPVATDGSTPSTEGEETARKRFVTYSLFEPDADRILVRPPRSEDRNLYFGDLHVHTTNSFDAFAFGTLATPGDAYRYAKGEAIRHPGGFDVQLRQALDFYAVTDHASFLGVAKIAADESNDFSTHSVSKILHNLNAPNNMGPASFLRRIKAFSRFMPSLVAAIDSGAIEREEVLEITRSAWRETIEAAELHYEPGRFTTFTAFEYTSSTDDSGNLHRNVVFRGGGSVPAVPFSRFHSQNPEGLWDWMDALRAEGIESLAIPHNSNGSNGHMFEMTDWNGEPIDDAYAQQRMRNEPVVEITQVKGTSETHPSLSTRDEWADFEITPYRVATMKPSEPAGSYVRDALLRGLLIESGGVENPYNFGIMASSDTHTGAISDDESNFFSKLGLLDATPKMRGSVPMGFIESAALRFLAPGQLTTVEGEQYINAATPTYGASGLAAVWAEENTREAIFDALRRKETFATSGPRIRLRVFAGHDLPSNLLTSTNRVALGYAHGVPMGGGLSRSGDRAPEFAIWATADPLSARLQRVQVVKGWVEDGEAFEEVFDAACSDGLDVDAETRRCPDNGAQVDLSDCSISTELGDAELAVRWRDPDFDPGVRAFYYVRVLENPTCRWSTWDALREGVEPRPDLAKTLQERAWSSPIAYVPTP